MLGFAAIDAQSKGIPVTVSDACTTRKLIKQGYGLKEEIWRIVINEFNKRKKD